MLNKFTVDLEDWFHGMKPDPSSWRLYDRRSFAGTTKLLRLLEQSGTKATFFVLGDVARHEPDVVRAVDDQGHEIGTHGMLHQRVMALGPAKFREDLRQSTDILEQITGKKVISYRAPYFSVDPGCEWFFDALEDQGIVHDSSVFPARGPYYGSPGATLEPYDARPAVREWPISVATLGPCRLPFAGGAWFRILPMQMFSLLRARHTRANIPLVFYIHPYDLDPDQPRIVNISRSLRYRHYYSLHRTEEKLRQLLSDVAFEPLAPAQQAERDLTLPPARQAPVADAEQAPVFG